MTPEQLSRDVMPIATARFDANPGSHAPGWTAWTLHSDTLSEGYYESWTWSFNYTRSSNRWSPTRRQLGGVRDPVTRSFPAADRPK